MCMADTTMGDKSKAAMEVCGDGDGKNANERSLDLMRKKGKGKPNKGNCPKAKDVLQVVLEKYSWEICMYSELGWVDSDMAPVEEVVKEDIETLPSEMADALLGDGFDSCVTKMEEKILKKIMKDKDLGLSKKCLKKLSDDDEAMLRAALNGVSRTECFKDISEKSCGEFVMNLVDSMAEGSSSGSGSA